MAKIPGAAPAPDPQIIPANSDLDAEFFFEENKGKIIGIIVVALVALAGFAIYQYTQKHALAEAQAAFYAAKDVAGWQSVIAKYPGSLVAGNAELLLADKLRDQSKLDEALAVLTTFTSTQANHPLAAEGWLSYAATLETKGDLPKAAQTYANIAGQFSTTEAAPSALASQARLAKKTGDLKKAREVYENIVQRFPTSFWSQEAQQELARLPQAEVAATPAPPPVAPAAK